MTECTQESFEFPACKRRVVEANFQGGDISCDGGVLLLHQLAHKARQKGFDAPIVYYPEDRPHTVPA